MTTLTLTRPLAEAATPTDGPGRLLIQIITPGWGSSGYYSEEALTQAAADRVFPAGTHMYLDHPTPTENYERPARSVRDLAAVLMEDARWDPQARRLVAEARVFSQWRQPIADMAETIGVSIRAEAEVEMGEAEGRTGQLITRLTEARSIDFVTKAGRDGRVVAVLESAEVAEARNVGQWVESRIHRDFTSIADEMFGDGRLTRPERIALSSAIGDALSAFVTRVEADAPDLYDRDPWADPPATPMVAENSPVTPAGTTPPPTSEEDTMPTIEEARLRQLEEADRRVPVLETELATERKRAETAEAELAEARKTTNRAVAEGIVHEAFEAAKVSAPKTAARIASTAPLTESGSIDTDALKTAATEAAAEIAEAAGVGSVRGMGHANPTPPEANESALKAAVARAFGNPVQEA